jgi:competence protein ComGC
MKSVNKILKNEKGSAIFQMIIVIAIVAILAVTTLPNRHSWRHIRRIII